ncbi:zinc finger, CCHC-type containing protein [Tanacetum coccineum]|uniref:Zinc finger, CCHC-type containing protein n=1 Tax=Tanacetum coccineum TaxID=301880 RepID=A0ABQ4YPR1_9ASTR
MTTTVVNNSIFRGFFEKQKLTGLNFIDWYRQLRIVLSTKDKLNYLELLIYAVPILTVAGHQVPPETLVAHATWVKGQKEIVVLMLMTMEPDLQRNLENLSAYDMLKELKTLFSKQAEQELLETVRDFHTCKQEEGQFVSSYVLKMKSYIDNSERLCHPMSLSLAVSLILVSMRKEYDSFMQNYNMYSMGKMVNELHAILKLHEKTLPKRYAPALHAIRSGKVQKKNKNKKLQLVSRGNTKGKRKSKLAYAPKPKIPPPPNKVDHVKDLVCHHYGIFTIELFTFPGKSWVYDTGCGTHICNTTQRFRRSRKLKPGALSLYMGNGQRAAIKAIGSYDLCFPIRLVIVLHNCHYAPSITRGVISVYHLYDDGFINHFENDNSISVSKNNLIYFNAISRDGIYEIILSGSNTNVSSIHISKKRIEKLQHDGLLNSIDTKPFEKCVSCLSGKMARKPYSHQLERAKDLLGLIHTDVCGPFRIMSRQEASYFVTFTNDFSRYGYVYLLKHKHEVFETFKVFQKEVENQLGKTIKSLRSDKEDTHPSGNTSSHHDEDNQEIDKPQSDIIPIRRSTRTRHALDRMCLNIKADEYELGDLNEPANYKWLNAMNVEMQSMKDNEV